MMKVSHLLTLEKMFCLKLFSIFKLTLPPTKKNKCNISLVTLLMVKKNREIKKMEDTSYFFFY